MKNNNLYLKDFFKNQVKPKMEDEEQIEQFELMSSAMDEIGVGSYHMTPEQIMDELSPRDPVAKFEEQEWLHFISNKSIATFLERELIKMNKVILRQKIAQAAMGALTPSDIKMIGILKQMIDSADTSDDSVIHYSQFIPLRESKTNSEESKPEDVKESVMGIIDLLEVDTDYMNIIDAKKAKEVELEKMRKYRELDNLASIEEQENKEEEEIKEEIQAEIIADSVLYTEVDDLFQEEGDE